MAKTYKCRKCNTTYRAKQVPQSYECDCGGKIHFNLNL